MSSDISNKYRNMFGGKTNFTDTNPRFYFFLLNF